MYINHTCEIDLWSQCVIELSICLGQLTDVYMLDKMNNEVVDSSFKIAQSRLESIEKYVDFLKEEKKNTDWFTVLFGGE